MAVVGAGAFGSWIALQAVRAGFETILVDQNGPANDLSSSGGSSRIIRRAYGPDEIYTLFAKTLEGVSFRRKSTRLFPAHRRPVDGKRGRALNSRGAGNLPPS